MTDDEKATVGYQAAISLIGYGGQLIWISFGTMVTANTFVIALGGLAASKFSDIGALRLIPFLGWVLCFSWILITERQFGYYGYWFAWARYLEQKLSPIVRITIEGHRRFSKGETPEIDPSNESGKDVPRLWALARLLRVKYMMYVVILIFVFLYYILYDAIT